MPVVTRLLEAAAAGDRRAADDLLPVVYGELRRLAAAKLAQEHPGQTLRATALVHDAYLSAEPQRRVQPDFLVFRGTPKYHRAKHLLPFRLAAGKML